MKSMLVTAQCQESQRGVEVSPHDFALRPDERDLLSVYGIALIADLRDRVLAGLLLSPLSLYPKCDLCANEGTTLRCLYGRVWMHPACHAQALEDHLQSVTLPPFPPWVYRLPEPLMSEITRMRRTKNPEALVEWLEDFALARRRGRN